MAEGKAEVMVGASSSDIRISKAAVLDVDGFAKAAGAKWWPYALVVGAFWFLPFIWFGSLLWLLSLPFFYLAARILVGINPNGHRVFYVMARRLKVNVLAPRAGNRDYV